MQSMALIIKRSVTAMKPPAAPVPAAGRPAPAKMGFTDVLLKPITKEKFASVVG